jgi:hypothetical protein
MWMQMWMLLAKQNHTVVTLQWGAYFAVFHKINLRFLWRRLMLYFKKTPRPLAAMPRWFQRLSLVLVAASTLSLIACGGGGSESSASTPSAGESSTKSNAPPSLQAISSVDATIVSIGNAESLTSGTTSTMQVMQSAALDFDGKVLEGPSKNTQLVGTLLINAESTDGGENFSVTGELVQRNAAQEDASGMGADDAAQIKAALQKFFDGSKVKCQEFSAGVSDLSQTTDALLKVERAAYSAIPANATDAQAQYAAIGDKVKAILETFSKQLDALQDKLAMDLKALNDTLQAELQAIKTDPSSTAKSSVTVTGTLTAAGKISLTFDLGGGNKILGIGQSDAKGKFTGTFTGPASGDKGSWSANPILRNTDVKPPTTPGTPPEVIVTPPPSGATCTTGTLTVDADISEIKAPNLFIVAKGLSVDIFKNGILIDSSEAKFVNGTAADIVVGRRVRVCSDDTNVSAEVPVKANTVIFK